MFLPWRTLILWGVLIGGFSAVYAYVRTGQLGEYGHVGALALLLLVAFALGGWTQLGARRWTKANNRGTELLRAGNLEEAAEQFLVASKKAQNKFQRAFAEFNLGYCRFEMGQLEEAAALLRRVDDSGGLRRNREASALLANHLSTCYALLGDVGAARSMLEEGVRRRTEGYDSHPLLAEVLILCREDHFGAAAKTLESRWREVEMSGGVYQKMLRVLRAFALDTVDPAANAQAVMEALAGAKPLAPATLQTLTAHWPKMREFLVAQKLVAAA